MKLKQSQVVNTNTTKGSVCKIDAPAISFQQLLDNYVTGAPYDNPAYDNQCAIRMSATLHKVGIEMKSFSQKLVKPSPGTPTIGRIFLDGKPTATRADEMAQWLRHQPFCGLPIQPEDLTGKDWESKARGALALFSLAAIGHAAKMRWTHQAVI